MSNLIYINSGFDVELSGRSLSKYSEKISELELNGLMLSKPGDTVISDALPCGDFYEYMQRMNVTISQNIKPEEFSRNYENLILWGYNSLVLEKISLKGFCEKFLNQVKIVNGREFSANIQKELNFPIVAEVLKSREEAIEFASKFAPLDIVFKSNFGSSGTGFVLCRGSKLSDKEIRAIDRLLKKDGSLITGELWGERLLDFSCVFNVDYNGSCSDLYMNVLQNRRKGVFSAVYCAQGDNLLKKYISQEDADYLKEVCTVVSTHLFEAGYTGYAGIDGFIYENEGKKVLQPFCEINARMSMARYAVLVKSRLSCKNGFAGIFTAPYKSNRMLNSYEDLIKLFGKYNYSPENKEGILILNPLNYIKNGMKFRSNTVFVGIFANSYETFEEISLFASKIF